ncbi:HAD hydrolase family protein, partial [Cutibacterium acnes]
EGVTKASALDALCRLKGIDPKDVLAIGDGNNDIEMLQWAGRGVAIGDASEQVQAAADDIAPCFEDGGTAVELGRWF